MKNMDVETYDWHQPLYYFLLCEIQIQIQNVYMCVYIQDTLGQ